MDVKNIKKENDKETKNNNISLLKKFIEKLNNGYNSIINSLNEIYTNQKEFINIYKETSQLLKRIFNYFENKTTIKSNESREIIKFDRTKIIN